VPKVPRPPVVRDPERVCVPPFAVVKNRLVVEPVVVKKLVVVADVPVALTKRMLVKLALVPKTLFEKKLVVVALVPVPLLNVKFWSVDEPFNKRFVRLPVVPNMFVEKRFVDVAFVVVEFVALELVNV
jgi:hypothetical protein